MTQRDDNARVSDQYGVSLLYIMLEIHHSDWEPSNYVCLCMTSLCVCLGLHFSHLCQSVSVYMYVFHTNQHHLLGG